MPKATAVFDADDSRLSGALARINGKMLALQSRIAKFAAAFIALRAVAGVVTAGFDCGCIASPVAWLVYWPTCANARCIWSPIATASPRKICSDSADEICNRDNAVSGV